MGKVSPLLFEILSVGDLREQNDPESLHHRIIQECKNALDDPNLGPERIMEVVYKSVINFLLTVSSEGGRKMPGSYIKILLQDMAREIIVEQEAGWNS